MSYVAKSPTKPINPKVAASPNPAAELPVAAGDACVAATGAGAGTGTGTGTMTGTGTRTGASAQALFGTAAVNAKIAAIALRTTFFILDPT